MLPIQDISKYLSDARILLIDDSSTFQRLTVALLRKIGVASVTIASSLEQGMLLMHYNRKQSSVTPEFDLVLMDINLPDGNGIEGCKFISGHAATYNIPVVVISGLNSVGIISEAFKAGASEYLHKPLVADLLRVRLGAILKSRFLEMKSSQFEFEPVCLNIDK